MEAQQAEGWYIPQFTNATSYHYTRNGKRSLCGRYGTLGTTTFLAQSTIQPNGEPPETCCKNCLSKVTTKSKTTLK